MSVISYKVEILNRENKKIQAIFSRPLCSKEKNCIVFCHDQYVEDQIGASFIWLTKVFVDSNFAVLRYEVRSNQLNEMICDLYDVMEYVHSLDYEKLGIVAWKNSVVSAMLSATDSVKSFVALFGSKSYSLLSDFQQKVYLTEFSKKKIPVLEVQGIEDKDNSLIADASKNDKSYVLYLDGKAPFFDKKSGLLHATSKTIANWFISTL